jgi:biotin carboxylase
VLLVFAASTYRLDAFLDAARRIGVELVLATDLPRSFARKGAPVHGVDFADAAGSARRIAGALRQQGLSGALGTHEASAVVAAMVAAELGLPHASPDGVLATRDKRKMRERFAAAGLPAPRFTIVEPTEDPLAVAERVRFPCVVKPPMLSGSQGVIRADDAGQLAQAIDRTRRIIARHASALASLPEFHPLLVEDYLPGREVAVEAVVVGGGVRLLCIFDKPDELVGPYFEETLYVTPSRLSEDEQAAALAATRDAARALGLAHGPVHAELRVHEGRATVIEIAARSIGGMCSRAFEGILGSLEELLLGAAIGEPAPPAAAAQGAAGVMMLPIPRSGVLRGVRGVERARAVPGVVGVEMSIAPGDAIRALPEGGSYLGFVFARGETPAGVERALRAAHAAIELDLSPLLT